MALLSYVHYLQSTVEPINQPNVYLLHSKLFSRNCLVLSLFQFNGCFVASVTCLVKTDCQNSSPNKLSPSVHLSCDEDC